MRISVMRVLVTGGRGFTDLAFLTSLLDAVHKRYPIASLLHGGGIGTDMMANYWAEQNGIPVEVFHADWETYGDAAEPVRNTLMLATKPDLVVVFPGGRHTAICKRQAETAGLKVFEPAYRPVIRVQAEPEPPPEEAPADADGFVGTSRGLWTKT
jgi:hypothetical protein